MIENNLQASVVENYQPPETDRIFQAVSFFAGCGGLDLGFTGDFISHGETYQKTPFNIIRAYDNDKKCVETYKLNVGDHIEQLDLATGDVSLMPGADILIGGFPCQAFSSCGPQEGLNSERGQLYRAFIRYMEEHRPKVVVAENVPHLKYMQEGKVIETIINDLEVVGPGYSFKVWDLKAVDYGVPQNRKRLFLIGVRRDLPGFPEPPSATHADKYRSIDWAIEDLEDVIDETVPNQSQYFRAKKAKKGNGQGDEVNVKGQPSYTIRANAKSRVQFHYSLPRRLTVRECARLQTFPDEFKFPHSATANVWQIGNAVPPVLAHHVAMAINDYCESLVDYSTHRPLTPINFNPPSTSFLSPSLTGTPC